MKKIFVILGIIIIFFICVFTFQNLIIKFVVTDVASRITGAPVYMDSFSLDVFSSTIHITGFKMNNPSGFPDGLLVSCPKINVIFDRASLFTNKRHFYLLEVELNEMVITKNKEGKLNVDALKVVHASGSSPAVPMQIDLLNLSIGKIIYKDYTAGNEPSVRVYDVNKHKSYKRIPTAQQLALLVLSEPMKSAAIKDAEIYGVAMMTGVAMLPVAVVATFVSKDSVEQSINSSPEHAFDISIEAVKGMGIIIEQDSSDGIIKASIHGSRVAIKIKKDATDKTIIIISARKYMLPQPDIAEGVLYQILEKL